MENFYEILQIPETAKRDEIAAKIAEEQRKWLGRTNAPDLKRRQEAESKLALIEEASVILLDDTKRAKYDKELADNKYQNTNNSNDDVDRSTYNDEQLIDEVWELLRKNRVADAIVVGKRATEKNAGNANAWSALARAHYRWNEYDDAVYEYKKAIDIETNNPIHYYDLCDVYFDHPKIDREETLRLSEDLIQKALRINPTERAYKFRMANIYKYKGEYEKAINLLKEIINTHGNDASLSDEIAINILERVKRKMYYQNGSYYFVSKEVSEYASEQLKEAKTRASSDNLLYEINSYMDSAEKSLKKRLYKSKFFLVSIIPIMWLLIALGSGSFGNIIFAALLIFLAYKFTSVPIWKENYQILTGKRQQEKRVMAAAFAEAGKIFRRKF